jgi:hypothetical protein
MFGHVDVRIDIQLLVKSCRSLECVQSLAWVKSDKQI